MGSEWEHQLLSGVKTSSDSTQINEEESDDELETLQENDLTNTDVNDMLEKIIAFAKINYELVLNSFYDLKSLTEQTILHNRIKKQTSSFF